MIRNQRITTCGTMWQVVRAGHIRMPHLIWAISQRRGVALAVVYYYQRTQGDEHPRNFLTGFKGYLLVDG
ncbi:transposase [Brevibacillus laterosporus]|uniref:IS66 family transposase n=1 Tax=Brevibacillus laterosporus TaxID=1465 RepID=UPI0035A5A2AB